MAYMYDDWQVTFRAPGTEASLAEFATKLQKYAEHPIGHADVARMPLPNLSVLDGFLQVLGIAAAPVLFDILAVCRNEEIRRELMRRLVKMGPEVSPLAVERLADPRWDVRRDLLAVIAGFGELPYGFDPWPYTRDTNDEVRLAAFRICLNTPSERADGIKIGLRDHSEAVLRRALHAAEEDPPRTADRALSRLARDETAPPVLRMVAVRILGTLGTNPARQTLLDLASLRRRFLVFKRLPRKTPELLAVIEQLAEREFDDPRVDEILRHALGSPDPEIRRLAAPAAERLGFGPARGVKPGDVVPNALQAEARELAELERGPGAA